VYKQVLPWVFCLFGCWLSCGSFLLGQVVTPAPPLPDAFILGNKSRKLELAVTFDGDGYVQKIAVEQSCGIPHLDRDTASFIQSNWRRTDCGGKTVIVPLVFNPPPFLPRPAYPLAAAEKKLSGSVFFTVEFNRDGDVINVTVTQSSGHPELDQGLVAFVTKYWRFPAVPDTEPPVRAIRTSSVFLFQPGPHRTTAEGPPPADLEQIEMLVKKGTAAAREGDAAKVRACFDKLLSEKPNNPQLMLSYGAALFDLGNYQEALSRWQAAFATMESNSLGDKPPVTKFIYQALAYWALGDKSNAFASCSDAARLYPELYSERPPIKFFDTKSTKMGGELFEAWYKSKNQ